MNNYHLVATVSLDSGLVATVYRVGPSRDEGYNLQMIDISGDVCCREENVTLSSAFATIEQQAQADIG